MKKTLVLAFNQQEYRLYLAMMVPADKWRDHFFIARAYNLRGFKDVDIVKTRRFGKRVMTFDEAMDFHNSMLVLLEDGARIVHSAWDADDHR